MSRKTTVKDWVLYFISAGLIGGLIGLAFSITSFWFWIIDIPALFWLNWWFIYRVPKEKDLKVPIIYAKCSHFMCKRETVEDDDYCEAHKI